MSARAIYALGAVAILVILAVPPWRLLDATTVWRPWPFLWRSVDLARTLGPDTGTLIVELAAVGLLTIFLARTAR